ncbi:50S ribosomal protein L33 [Mycoplasmopsis pullorum]|nr:50S ribosomal protein L33 [Mycoplasmopsis pullorum]TNK82413.1 50S ribosomal protein L33 [Mycoplasmopsis pullorum]TNK82816.1 50S ribosomal protein L33 [Mycoplasmopsis pullorum]TNK83660.1 50S ribosomal protein L33 [Mycoplasmopsis pullorum]TNK84897.1 50S ribosomal protein L33 [Mycoplasmopsis pullorum]TNK85241.1 50S ribosomal protein L33 [Mycoplasmopsis pullorum]
MQKKKIALACEVCRRKNYYTNKSFGNQSRIIIKKHCTNCNNHTIHKEEK